MSGRLTLVGTPIGNLSDLSPRAVEALRACDFIAAEDTRVTLKLLNHFGIQKPLSATLSTTNVSAGEVICAPVAAGGERSAGYPTRACPLSPTPAKSWWTWCHERQIPVGVVPGPTGSDHGAGSGGTAHRPFLF